MGPLGKMTPLYSKAGERKEGDLPKSPGEKEGSVGRLGRKRRDNIASTEP